jgi:hypothetical protein
MVCLAVGQSVNKMLSSSCYDVRSTSQQLGSDLRCYYLLAKTFGIRLGYGTNTPIWPAPHFDKISTYHGFRSSPFQWSLRRTGPGPS